MSTAMPVTMAPASAEAIPAELRSISRWVVWGFVDKGRPKPAKVPFMPGTRQGCDYTKPAAWQSFTDAYAEALDRGDVGIGFVFTTDDDVVAIDLDNAIDDHGEVRPWAAEILERVPTWTERSPSGRGFHLIGHADAIIGKTKRDVSGDPPQAVERYSQDRYLTFTGDVYIEKPLADIRDGMAWLESKWFVESRKFKNAVRAVDSRVQDPELDVELARVCLGLLHPCRASSGEDWRRVGYSLKAVGESMFGDWLSFSSQWPDYSEAECTDRWNRFKTATCGLQTLVGMAADDSGRTFGDIRREAAANLGRAVKPAGNTAPPGLAMVLSPTDDRPYNGPADVADYTTWNDNGLAKRLVRDAGDRLRFLVDRGIWLAWTGTHWQADPHGLAAQREAKAIGSRLWQELIALGNERASTPLYQFVRAANDRKKIDAAVALAREGLILTTEKLDADPYLFNCRNGTLDLRTGDLRPHDPADLITLAAAVDYDPTATAPKFEKFLDDVTCGDDDLAAFLQRSFGLALSSDQSEQKFWIHYGNGSNGKGTFLSVVGNVFGMYAGPFPVDVLLARGNDGDRALKVGPLVGRRLAYAQEADENARLSEATMKALTGSDKIPARFLYQNQFEVSPTWHLHMAVNDRPIVRTTDHGTWRRILLVPWKAVFDGTARRADVESALASEGSGILNWLLAGFAAWRAGGLQPPFAVTGATKTYRDESDSIEAWIADACVRQDDAESGATDLYQNYCQWCERAGYDHVSQTKFGRQLDSLGHAKRRATTGSMKLKIVPQGLRLAASLGPLEAGW